MSANPEFKCDYAKSGRSSCKLCKSTISKGATRIAKMVQSFIFDGITPNWYHMSCFFKTKGRMPLSEGEIDGLADLRWEDQEQIRKKISASTENVPELLESAYIDDDVRKEIGNLTEADKYLVEYAKTSRSKCNGCVNKIAKGNVRLSKKDLARGHIKVDKWFHLDCFPDDFEGKAESFDGFVMLTIADKTKLIEKFGSGLCEESKQKLLNPRDDKNETAAPEPVKKSNEELKQLNKLIWELKDKLEKTVDIKTIKEMLSSNNQHVPSGESALIDTLADRLMFGCLPPCPECSAMLASTPYGYKCTGNFTEWTKCQYFSSDPPGKRTKLKCDNADLMKLARKPTTTAKRFPKRVFPEKPKTVSRPLNGMKFVLSKLRSYKESDAKLVIERAGGKVVARLTNKVTGIIGSDSSKKSEAERLGVAVIDESLIKLLVDCGNGENVDLSEFGLKMKLAEDAEKPSKMMKLTVKGDDVMAVDPDAMLSEDYHVLSFSDEKGRIVPMSAVLNLVDISRSSNSYYKIQILEQDCKSGNFYVFRSWGRVGTNIGGTKLDEYSDKHEAVEQFENIYFEKTGNLWENRDKFEKVPNKFYPVEIDYQEVVSMEKSKKVDCLVESKLLPEIQILLKMILDVDAMNKMLLEFEIDLSKMPLGKISKRRIHEAFEVLTRLQDIVNLDGAQRNQLLDLTNRFFTLVPHDFGLGHIPILDNQDKIKAKSDMLSNMLEIEVAYSMLNSTDLPENADPLEAHYRKLNCEISVLNETDSMHRLICEYAQNTHGSTHDDYSIVIEQIFSVKRQDEESKYLPFRKALCNRTLLWHGSRTTNYAGILSQGLRIAPPEAPVTGYMFGKGVYFADMISKSANYCFASPGNDRGLLLLSEVALGNIMECKGAKFVKKLPAGMHSCKGVGKTFPNPESDFMTDDGVRIPMGKLIADSSIKSSLLYNEYIVYDVNQINLKYLLQVKFDFKKKL